MCVCVVCVVGSSPRRVVVGLGQAFERSGGWEGVARWVGRHRVELRSGWVGPLKGWVAVGSVGSGRVGRVGGNMLPSQVVDFMVVLINIFNFSPVDKRWLKPN